MCIQCSRRTQCVAVRYFCDRPFVVPRCPVVPRDKSAPPSRQTMKTARPPHCLPHDFELGLWLLAYGALFNLQCDADYLSPLERKKPKSTMNFFVYAWSPELQQIVRQVVHTDLKWSTEISITKSVVTLQQGHSLRTPVGKQSIIIAMEEGVESWAAIHNEEDELKEVTWRSGIGYRLQQFVSIRATKHEITMMLLVIAPESQGAHESQSTAEHITGSKPTN
ncbi:hypothetical protein BR93DRAFT_392668 [Coniochaeta sp. PMI_546]|nr:hypothetical protein BR93DRAFT_392668 [Coniochaeta sp. PMI_546]